MRKYSLTYILYMEEGEIFGEKFLDEVTKPNKALYTPGGVPPFILNYKPINQVIIVFCKFTLYV